MTVLELSKKYNVKTTEIMVYIDRAGLPNLAVTDSIPADVLARVEKMLGDAGIKPVPKVATLIKKKIKPEEDASPAKKKLVIKKPAPAKPAPAARAPGGAGSETESAAALPRKPSVPRSFAPSDRAPRDRGERPRAPGAGPAKPMGSFPRGQGDRPRGDRRDAHSGAGLHSGAGSQARGAGTRAGVGAHAGAGFRSGAGGMRPASGMGMPLSQGGDRRGQHKGAVRNKERERRDRLPDKRWNENSEILRSKPSFKKKTKRETQLASVPDKIEIMETITVSELARKMNLPAKEIIAKLMTMGMMTTINQPIDADTAVIVASEYGCTVRQVSLYDETVIEEAADVSARMAVRPPIVTVMGHVDHGKTKLLDAIRESNVVDTESGGITQHIGAYQVRTKHGSITFIDTPGHEAFASMRERGAKVTDIVVLVVAADDGVMPQTLEAARHAIQAKVPIVVAINKMDKADANIDRVKQQLADRLDLLAEDWGGKTMCVPISALQKKGIPELLDAILLQAEMLELRADPGKLGTGSVIEARIGGKGTTITVLCQAGSMSVGDNFVAGVHYGRIRAMYDDRGERIDKIGPSMCVEILGSSGLPQAGDPLHIVESEKRARTISAKRLELRRFEDAKNVQKITADNIFDKLKLGETKELKVIIKADVQGSAEALKTSLENIKNAEVRLTCIRYSAGAINEDDVMLAATSKAIIIGFNVRPNTRARETAEREHVEIRPYTIIYDAINDIEAALRGMMTPELQERVSGSAEVRAVYKVPKAGVIAGCYVISGTILRNNKVRVIREGEVIFEGKVSSLKRFKDDAREVAKGYECGIGVEGYDDIRIGDVLENYHMQEVMPGKAKAE
ncbi:MAG: translation initiation factor IF-2 [Spirochaetota bacterium]|jgi:translation initiation factor IF-2|nr:translation initiation factor IF-2 [Spirochaetota bacterium]